MTKTLMMVLKEMKKPQLFFVACPSQKNKPRFNQELTEKNNKK